MWLADETFKGIIQHTPLISIDLIVRNEAGEVLLGKRVNAPAKGDWFVPGGRVLKNETLDSAFIRLLKDELGVESRITRADAKFLGVFEHFYDDCVFGDGVSTHYVVLAYELILKKVFFELLPYSQHREFEWISKSCAVILVDIHPYTHNYFISI